MESSIFKPSSMDLIRAGLQDLDKARTSTSSRRTTFPMSDAPNC